MSFNCMFWSDQWGCRPV